LPIVRRIFPKFRLTVGLFRSGALLVASVLLMLLAAAAACPALHHWLHGEDAHDSDDNCAVVLFANGITLAAAAVAAVAPRTSWREFRPSAVEEIFLASPRYLRQPERGPPSC
jgi:hypothetical protein